MDNNNFSEDILNQIIQLHDSGKCFSYITVYLNQKGIKIKYGTVKKLYNKQRGKENRAPAEKIIISNSDISKGIKNFELNNNEDTEERKVTESKSERRTVKNFDMLNDIKDILLSGLTIDEWVYQMPEKRKVIKDEIKERVELLKIIAKHAGKEKDNTWRVDESFLEMLNLASSEGDLPERLDYRKLREEIMNKKRIDLISIRYFENRQDTFRYLLGRLAREQGNVIKNPFDKKLYEQYTTQLITKIHRYNLMAERIQNRKKIEKEQKRIAEQLGVGEQDDERE